LYLFAEHAKPSVVVRKPRTKRLFHSLLCCFGAHPSSSGTAMGGGGVNGADYADDTSYRPVSAAQYQQQPLQQRNNNIGITANDGNAAAQYGVQHGIVHIYSPKVWMFLFVQV
jgi:hypothetical protein